MKRTDMEKKEREMKRARKKLERVASTGKNEEAASENMSVSFAFNTLTNMLQFDEREVYNILGNEVILEHLLYMQESFSEKEMENILRKAVKKTRVLEKEKAIEQLKSLLD